MRSFQSTEVNWQTWTKFTRFKASSKTILCNKIHLKTWQKKKEGFWAFLQYSYKSYTLLYPHSFHSQSSIPISKIIKTTEKLVWTGTNSSGENFFKNLHPHYCISLSLKQFSNAIGWPYQSWMYNLNASHWSLPGHQQCHFNSLKT